jgi:transposase
MDIRDQKALEIADKFRITEAHGRWTVPSQSGPGKHTVTIQNYISKCTCLDFEERRAHCKHILAVHLLIERAANPQQAAPEVPAVSLRKTYPQNWKAYNAAQTSEQDQFQILLYDLCSGVLNPVQHGRGRRTLPLADIIFSAAYKVYSTVSGRRFMSDLRAAQENGFIDKAPHYNSIFNYLENPDLTPILRNLITESSLPLKAIETDFAVDSTGFSTCRFERWFDHKYGSTRMKRDWVKAHVMCGVKTNIVTSIEIHDKNAADSPVLPPLVRSTRKNFRLREVSADKGYLSVENARVIKKAGATPFIAFKSNNNDAGKSSAGLAWRDMFHHFQFHREDFLAHYHKRSNVETTFSMMKRKFGDSIRSKTDTAMKNEVLCKVLCHNIVVVIHEMLELGIQSNYCAE